MLTVLITRNSSDKPALGALQSEKALMFHVEHP